MRRGAEKKQSGESRMNRGIWLAAGVLTLCALLLAAGCGGSSTSTAGNSSSGEVSEASLGVPIYHGATEQDMSAERPTGSFPGGDGSWPGGGPPPGSSAPSWNGQSAPSGADMQGGPPPGRMFGGMTALWTADSVEKVTSWYREELKGKSGFNETTALARGPVGGSGGVMFSFESGDTTRTVAVRESNQGNGGTVIMIGDAPQGMPMSPPADQNQQ